MPGRLIIPNNLLEMDINKMKQEINDMYGVKPFTRAKGFWNIPDAFETDKSSQRENWFERTDYISEFWCALSNIGFLIVGWYFNSYVLIIAGLASFLCHSIPLQLLLYIDKFCAMCAVYQLVEVHGMQSYKYMIPLGIMLMIDTYVSRAKQICWCHVMWHFVAAAIALTALSDQSLSSQSLSSSSSFLSSDVTFVIVP